MSESAVSGAASQLAAVETKAADAAPPTAAFGADLTGEERSWFDVKGFKTLPDMARSYRDLEKLIGVKDRLVQLPSDDAAEAWNAVYDRLGRPKTAEEYKLDIPEGADATLAPRAAKWFHEAGLSPRQAQPLVKEWNAYVAEMAQQEETRHATALQEEGQALKTDWGDKYDANLLNARKAAGALGLSTEQVDALERAVGFKSTLQIFAKMYDDYAIGREAGLTGGRLSGGGGTAAEAQREIAARKLDSEFSRKLAAGDTGARQLWENLHRRAFPETNG